MKIYVVRHGLTHSNKIGVLNGQAIDEPLEPEGIEQAKETAKNLPDKISKIYCSNMVRAVETAQILNKDLNIEIVYCPELREVDFGKLSGMSWGNIVEKFGTRVKESYISQEYDFTPFLGESFDFVKDRIIKIIEQIKKDNNTEDNIMIVAHGGILRVFYHLYKEEHHEGFKSASIHEFDI